MYEDILLRKYGYNEGFLNDLNLSEEKMKDLVDIERAYWEELDYIDEAYCGDQWELQREESRIYYEQQLEAVDWRITHYDEWANTEEEEHPLMRMILVLTWGGAEELPTVGEDNNMYEDMKDFIQKQHEYLQKQEYSEADKICQRLQSGEYTIKAQYGEVYCIVRGC